MKELTKISNKIRHQLKRSGIKPVHITGGLFIFLFLYFSSSFGGGKSEINSPYEAYTINSIDAYSSSVLSKVDPANPENPGTVNFNWRQFMGLHNFFKEHENLIQGKDCNWFGERLGKSETTRFNCANYPENKESPFSLSENMNLYMTDLNRKLSGKLHLADVLPNPSKLIYLFHDNKVEVGVNSDPRDEKILKTNLKKAVVPFTKFEQPLDKVYKSKKLKYDDFNYKKNLQTYENGRVRELHEAYKDSKRARKYFSEAFLLEKQGMFNTDWRFFNSTSILDEDSLLREDKVSKLIRTWLNFCEKYDFTSWVSNNNLVGWHFNGHHLPFELNSDFQIQIKDLLKMVDMNLNQSIIFDYSDLDKGIKSEVFMDISPYFKMRDRNNRENLIDIRLIDLETGYFIDIIAVTTFQYEKLYNFREKPLFQSFSDKDKPRMDKYLQRYKDNKETLLNNKNLEIFDFKDFETLVPIMFENRVSYLPKEFMKIITDTQFEPFKPNRGFDRFRGGVGMWVSTKQCPLPQFASGTSPEEDQKCLSNPSINQRYKALKKSLDFHEKYMDTFNKAEKLEAIELHPDDLSGFNYGIF